MSVKYNIEIIRKRISAARAQLACSSSEIAIVCVTKNRSFDEICQALDAGITHIGENRVQEAEGKIGALRGYIQQKNIPCTFHMIGHLQTNKAAKALSMFDMIQSVDSLKLCKKIHDLSQRDGLLSEVLIEVNTSKEATKYGISADELIPFLKKTDEFDLVKVRGLMTMAPFDKNQEAVRSSFRVLRNAWDRINALKKKGEMPGVAMDFLSMGMSSDYEIAVQEGANMVRIGSAIFEG